MKQAWKHIQQRPAARIGLAAFAGAAFFSVLGWSAAVAFQRHTQALPLAATQDVDEDHAVSLGERPGPAVDWQAPVRPYEEISPNNHARRPAPSIARTIQQAEPARDTTARVAIDTPTPVTAEHDTVGVKFDRMVKVIIVNGRPWTGETFDGQPIRPVKTRTMKTTAYSPDEKSCGKWADGITASGKSVWMNGGRLVAADKSVPFGTILTIPGYNDGKPVQVWDRGGAIKGNRLDLLYPTHEIARQWGVQDLPVVFWEIVETD